MNINMGTGFGNMPGMNIGGRFNQIPLEQPNPLHITFQNPHWPPNAITAETVLHYFCDPNNTFYDRTSDNEQLKMQNMGLQNFGALNQDLTRMNGIQYVLHSSCPPLYVICKQKRHTIANVTPLCYYYVLNGIIYQAPDLYSCVQSRLVGAVEPLKKALQITLEMSRFNVTKGYSWDFKTEPAKQKKQSKDEGKQRNDSLEEMARVRATAYQSIRTEMLFRLLHEQFPIESQTANPGANNQQPGSSMTDVAANNSAPTEQLTNDSPAFHQTSGPSSTQESATQPTTLSSTHANQSLELPMVLSSLPAGVSQMANDALSRLQSQIGQQQQRQNPDQETKMEVESSTN